MGLDHIQKGYLISNFFNDKVGAKLYFFGHL